MGVYRKGKGGYEAGESGLSTCLFVTLKRLHHPFDRCAHLAVVTDRAVFVSALFKSSLLPRQ